MKFLIQLYNLYFSPRSFTGKVTFLVIGLAALLTLVDAIFGITPE